MLSITLSGLHVSQKSLNVTSNNLANAGTTGFKRSEASFVDVFANDPTTGSKVAVGSGAAVGVVERSTAQGQLMTTDSVTDLAISGRGYFTVLATDPVTNLKDTYYTRSGNFSVNADGKICDSQGNLLQCFQPDEDGNITNVLGDALIEAQKKEGSVAVKLGPSASAGDPTAVPPIEPTMVQLYKYGVAIGDPHPVTAADIQSGFFTFASDEFSTENAPFITASYDENRVDVEFPLATDTQPAANFGDTIELWSAASSPTGSRMLQRHILSLKEANVTKGFTFNEPLGNVGPFDVKLIKGGSSYSLTEASLTQLGATAAAATEFRGIFVQSISISNKGIIQEDYSDGTKRIVGAIALATFSNESGLKPIGNTDFVACEASGSPTLTRAGAPYAGDIRSGTLEQSNVDITAELMGMLKAQQIYNGNARMLQTEVEIASRITDKL